MKQVLLSLFLLTTIFAYSQTWENPLRLSDEWEQYGIGDPYIMKYNGLFYLYCSTRDDQTGVKVWSSRNLVEWNYEGLCATDPITKGAYAPEVIQWGGHFYMYTSPAGNGHYVLKSNSPAGPFEVVTGNIGLSIDGSVFKEDDGSLYFYHADFNGIMGRPMNSPVSIGAGVKLASTSMRGWTEGPSLVKREGVYYMSYTGNHVISPGYRINFAVSKEGPLSGFVPDEQNPVIVNTEGDHVGLGHGTLFRGPNLDEYYTTYHNLVSLHQTGPFRNLNFDRVTFSGERMLFYGPNNTEQQTPLMPRFSDYFDASHQSVDWAFNTPGEWRVSDGSLLFEKDANQGQGERVALINEVPANNYIAEFNVAEFSTEDELLAGAVFNYVDEQNHGLILFSKDENKILVRFLVDGQSNYEQEALVTGVDNYSIFHAIRIQKENNHFSFYVDDMLKITAEEIMASGKLGLIAFSDKAKYGFSAFSNQFNGSSAFEVAKPAPGKFAATQYMKGGNGAGYKSDNQDINNYRYDNVAITNSQLNGLAVKAVAGEWFKYETMVASGGPYNVGIGCKPGSNGCKINLYQDDNLLGENISLPSITRNYREFAIEPVDLTAGASRIKVEVLEGEAEFTEFVFSHHTPVTEFEEPFDQRFRFAWNYDDGNWQLDNSNAYASGFGKRFMGYEGWTDYSVVTDIKYVSGMNAGIAFRAKNPAKGGPNDNPELGADFFQGYFVTIEANRVVLGKHNYNYEFLAQKAGSYSIDTWYKLAVTVKGNSIKVFVDDMENPVIDYTDNTPFLNGKAGLRVFNSDVLFDNFMVTSQPLSSVTMAKSLVKDQNLTVFPNPTRGEIKIDGLVNNATVNIVNLKGTVLSAFPLCNDKTIDLSSFARGIYWLLITEDNKIHKKEIVVLH